MRTRLSTAEARERALLAARDAILERGPQGFTVDAVAERSGVAKTTIYRGWPSVDHLMVDAAASVRTSISIPDTGVLRDDLIGLISNFAELAPRVRAVFIGVLAESMRRPEFDEIRRRMMSASDNPVREVLTIAMTRGELPPDLDLDLAADLIGSPVFMRLIIHGDGITQRATERHVDACLAAIAHLGDG